MTLITLGSLTLFAVTVILYRRSIEERVIRWKLYALRDELRDLAYKRPSLIKTQLFRMLDRSITGHCASLIDLSFWAILPVFFMDRRGKLEVEERQLALERQLQDPENAEIAKLFEQSVRLMTRHLLLRHMFLTLMAAVTLVGLVLLYLVTVWIARRVMSGAVQPVTETRPRVIAAA